MKKNINFNSDDQNEVNSFNKLWASYNECVEKSRQFKEGDYLLLHEQENYEEPNLKLKANSYGVAIRYLVVHVNEEGLSFVKEVTSSGKTTGNLICTASVSMPDHDDDKILYHRSGEFVWTLDPDYADSILLGEKYDPSTYSKEKKSLWKEITKHNKDNRINTKVAAELVDFLNKLPCGTSLYFSPKSNVIIKEKVVVTRQEFNNDPKYRDLANWSNLSKNVLVLTIKDKRGTEYLCTTSFFLNKALYKTCPRSYREIKS